MTTKNKYIPRLLHEFKNEISDNLLKELKLDNKMRVPKLEKISLNMGLGDARDNKNSLNQAIEELSIISGQKAVVTKSKKAISNFKLRIGDPVGVKVTLRGTLKGSLKGPIYSKRNFQRNVKMSVCKELRKESEKKH